MNHTNFKLDELIFFLVKDLGFTIDSIEPKYFLEIVFLQCQSDIWYLPVVLYCHVQMGPDSPNSKLSCYPWILLELTLRPFSIQKLIFGAYCILTKEIILGKPNFCLSWHMQHVTCIQVNVLIYWRLWFNYELIF